MHMSDALLSLPVGGLLWVATAATIGMSAHRLSTSSRDTPVARMGIMGAFVFASQMINFTIPGTGSSGHLGGGLLLAITLGPWAAFLTLASVLLIQALFFADGGLLAWGANVFNLGFFTCFLAYPLLFKTIAGNFENRKRVFWASLLAAIVGLQLGAFGVVVETVLSGISSLPFTTFVTLMQPIHLAIGVVEGLVTAGVVLFLHQAAPETFVPAAHASSQRRAWGAIAACALLVGSVFSWFASQNPDGLEWSIHGVTGKEEVESPASGTHRWFSDIQEKIAFLPDYAFPKNDATETNQSTSNKAEASSTESWPSVDAGTSLSGIVGGLLVAGLVFILAIILRLSRGKESLAKTS